MQRLPFETTHWSLIMAAGGADSAAARVAIARLCEKYWYPLYAYARRQGLDPDDARDLTQGFLTSLLERRDIENVRHMGVSLMTTASLERCRSSSQQNDM
jgi:DNA-directed RNA polymerase specialized sigma24 family protein